VAAAAAGVAAAAAAAAESKTSRALYEFAVDDLAIYSPGQEGQYEIVKIIQVEHVPGSTRVEFYTVIVEHSFDETRVGREPQIAAASAGSKLVRLRDAAAQGITVADVLAAGSHTGTRTKSTKSTMVAKSSTLDAPLFAEDEESGMLWFSSPSYKAADASTPFESFARLPINLRRYEMVGIVLGLAMYNGVLCRPHFPLCMMKLFLRPIFGGEQRQRSRVAEMQYQRLTPNIRDLRALHPTLAASLEQLLVLDGDTVDSLDLYFEVSRSVPVLFARGASTKLVSVTEPLLEQRHQGVSVESCAAAGLGPTKVTRHNVREYVRLYVAHLLDASCQYNHEAMSRGFLRVLGSPALALCSPRELESILCGMENIGSFRELQKGARYAGGFQETDAVIAWFWKIVSGYPETMKRRLLQFITGSERVPIKGLSAVKIVLQKSGDDDHRLPVAHTCFSTLDLPRYSSPGKLDTALRVALEFGTEGFGLA
jgi:hypothetical protein